MSQFLLLLRGGEYPESPEAMQQTIEKYTAWGQKLKNEGKYIAADPLHEGGKILRGTEALPEDQIRMMFTCFPPRSPLSPRSRETEKRRRAITGKPSTVSPRSRNVASSNAN